MSPLFVASYVLLWLLVFMLLILVLLIYREHGRSLMTPRGRIATAGLAVGEKAPVLSVRAQDDSPMIVDWVGATRCTVALFALPGCPICSHLWEGEDLAAQAAQWPGVEFIWVDLDQSHLATGPIPAGWAFAYSTDRSAHEAVELPASPYAYVVSTRAKVISKGLINHGEQLTEMLTEAFASDRANGQTPSPERSSHVVG
jgi:hypothetical protein